MRDNGMKSEAGRVITHHSKIQLTQAIVGIDGQL